MKYQVDISNRQDIIDVRDIIARVEELEDELVTSEESVWLDHDERLDLATLTEILDELKDCGGDEQWRGDWYPCTLIRDSYFQDYAEQFAEDIGAINRDSCWPNNCIDWEEAAAELQSDYSAVDYDGVDFWYR